MQPSFIDDLGDHATQVSELDVDVSQIYLSPGFAKAACRVAQHRVAIGEERLGEVTEAPLAAAPSVQQDDERMRPVARGHGDADIEQRAIHGAREETGTLASRSS